MKVFYTDIQLKLHRRGTELFGLNLTKDPLTRQLFPNVSPETKYVFTDGIGIWTTEDKPPQFDEYERLTGEKLNLVSYHLNRSKVLAMTTDIHPIQHLSQPTWNKYWISSSIHGEERIRILETPASEDEVLVNDMYFQIFEAHLDGTRHDGPFREPVGKDLYRLAIAQYEKPKSYPALLLLKFAQPPTKVNGLELLPEWFIEGYLALIMTEKGIRIRL